MFVSVEYWKIYLIAACQNLLYLVQGISYLTPLIICCNKLVMKKYKSDLQFS